MRDFHEFMYHKILNEEIKMTLTLNDFCDICEKNDINPDNEKEVFVTEKLFLKVVPSDFHGSYLHSKLHERD